MDSQKPILIVLLILLSLTEIYCQITRGSMDSELYISTDWYMDNSGQIHYAIFHSTNNGANIHLKYENIETPPGGEMSVGGVLGDATPGALYNFGNNELWVSLDYGVNWAFQEVYPDNARYLSGQIGGIIFKRIGAQLSQSINFGYSFIIITDPINCPLREPGYYLGEFYGINGNIGEGLLLDHTYDFANTFSEIPIDSAVAFWQVGGYYPQISRGTEAGELYLVSWWLNSNYKIFHSIDTGYTWTEKFESEYIDIYYWGVAYTAGREPGSFYVLRSRINPQRDHVWLYIDYSSDYGETFTTYFHDLDSLFTSVVDNPDPIIKLETYPNPFSNFTIINFEVLTPSTDISLVIYDSKGNIVRNLIQNKNYQTGTHSMKWYSDNDHGDKVNPGIYFYKLMSGRQMIVKKAIVVK